jgi:hypothetical protein
LQHGVTARVFFFFFFPSLSYPSKYNTLSVLLLDVDYTVA